MLVEPVFEDSYDLYASSRRRQPRREEKRMQPPSTAKVVRRIDRRAIAHAESRPTF
jgi:hypothetical protein